ncbi:MAG: inositol monophosphatase family protein [Rubrobacteraceae bacterium]
MSESPEEFHEFVCEISRRAGELQLSRLDDPGAIKEKAPRDIVTEVDLLCEELLVNAIEERYPEDSILSEERGGGISATGRSWLLDPLDGTANFARANPIFCCVVSVMEGGRVTNAAVSAPRLGDLYHARLGGGAHRDSNGKRTPLRVSDTEDLEYSFVGADLSFSRKRNAKYREPLEEIFQSSWQFRALGSAGVRGAWLAAGYLDVSIGTHNTPWDYAQTVLFASEAGGKATGLSGEPWTPSSEGLIATNGHLHEKILEIIEKSL